VHDELQFEVREEQAEEFGIMAVHAARDVAVHFDLRCPLDAEYHIGSNWAESH
jgi:DNA polymerase I-like protein with 3'-5' exonuclease and polymerase domains